MKVGTLCYATEQGLGYLAKDFYDNGVVTNPCIVHHRTRPEQTHWYPKSVPRVDVNNSRDREKLERVCSNVDVMLFFETPFVWELLAVCKRAGVRTALMVMHECTHDPMPAKPDILLAPSLLDLDAYPEARLIQVPVRRDWRLRRQAKVFVHNAGHGGLKGRNGTRELLEAWTQHRRATGIKLILRSQEKLDPKLWYSSNPETQRSIDVRIGTAPHESLYDEGDVFVFPEKFNGLSLPLQEAHASGMAVMATARHPNTAWLPLEPLIPVAKYRKARVGGAYREFDEAIIEPKAIAATIDNIAQQDISALSIAGRGFAERASWAKCKASIMEALR